MFRATVGTASTNQRMWEHQEEEEMTSYSPKDLAQEWEFKILRSNSGEFRNPARLRTILEEEKKRGGWALVEKFDNYRIRLKRPASVKSGEEDIASGYDPYRTHLPLSEFMTVLLIFGGAIGGMLAIFLFLLMIFH